MRYQHVKWLILLIPTILVGAWEYFRHKFLLPWLSMEAGNWMTPVIVFLVTITLLRSLFRIYDAMQEDLKRERAEKAVLQERERIARELHDGIAQTLFLMSIQLRELKQKFPDSSWNELERNLRLTHDNVRQSIFNLKSGQTDPSSSWKEHVLRWVREFETDTGIRTAADIRLEESRLLPREKAELFACIQEALTNVRKHSGARKAEVNLSPTTTGWVLRVTDDGKGISGDPFAMPDRFGLRIMRERAGQLGASLELARHQGKTVLVIRKEEQK
jgi:signal transduction histidine kinase